MNKQQARTLSGSTEIYADIVDIPSSVNAVRINGVKGTAGQVFKKNDTTNKVEWGDEQTITGTAPIAVDDGVVSLNSDMGSKSLTTTGTLTAEQLTSTDDITASGHIGCATLTATGDIVSQGNFHGDTATNIAFVNSILCQSIDVALDIEAKGHINGDGSTNITNMNNITATAQMNTATLVASGNISANGNINGDNSTNISAMNNITAVGTIQAEQLTSTDDITATGHIGSATLTTSGDITSNGDFVGDGSTDISSIADIGSATLTTTGNIVSQDDIIVRQVAGMTIDTITLSNDGNADFYGNVTVRGNLNGDGATNIASMNNITGAGQMNTATLVASGNISANGNIVGDGATNITSCIMTSATNHIPTSQIRRIYTGTYTVMDIGTSYAEILANFMITFVATSTEYMFKFGFYVVHGGSSDLIYFQLYGRNSTAGDSAALLGSGRVFHRADETDQNFVAGQLILTSMVVGNTYEMNVHVKESSSSTANDIYMGNPYPDAYFEAHPMYAETTRFTS
tara:strand:- start:5774 stop:7321 length:1548 start_codon:yes stop_codon:yes gene_type:complete